MAEKLTAKLTLPGGKEANLPVVVAARMSLSFPFLFRAVPLYTVDFTLLQRDTRLLASQLGLQRGHVR